MREHQRTITEQEPRCFCCDCSYRRPASRRENQLRYFSWPLNDGNYTVGTY